KARGHQHSAITTFNRRQSLLERKSGGRAEQTVAHYIEARLRVALLFPLGHVRRQNRRSVVDWGIDGAILYFRMTPEMGQERVLAVIPWPTITLHRVHSAVTALLCDRHPLATLNIIIILEPLHSTTGRCGRLAIAGQLAENPGTSADGVDCGTNIAAWI